jgi:hypothetical protein
MEGMPKLTEEHQKLHRLAGTWEGEEKMEPSPWGPGGTARGRYVSRVDLDGFYVIQDYTQEKDGKVSFRGHGVFGYDLPSKQVTWYWVDSTGYIPLEPSRGAWDGNTLTLTSRSPQGVGRYTFRLESKDVHHFVLENSFDGGATWKTFMSGSFRRVA